jgi:hypothetical protein
MKSDKTRRLGLGLLLIGGWLAFVWGGYWTTSAEQWPRFHEGAFWLGMFPAFLVPSLGAALVLWSAPAPPVAPKAKLFGTLALAALALAGPVALFPVNQMDLAWRLIFAAVPAVLAAFALAAAGSSAAQSKSV